MCSPGRPQQPNSPGRSQHPGAASSGATGALRTRGFRRRDRPGILRAPVGASWDYSVDLLRPAWTTCGAVCAQPETFPGARGATF
eukprot:3349291-Pyramimonas_sp.AAC.1